jgi:arylsulfatase B
MMLALALALLALASAAPNASAPTKPNLIFVLMDDFGWASLGIHNPTNPEIVTPNMDALIADGILLDRHYVFKYCSPSRCALQSGRNPIHVNVVNSPMAQHNEAVDPIGGYQGIAINMTTVASKLAGVGYKTAAVGKWNAGACNCVALCDAAPPHPHTPRLPPRPSRAPRRHGHQGAHAQGAGLRLGPDVL